jgi:hypothetical protein
MGAAGNGGGVGDVIAIPMSIATLAQTGHWCSAACAARIVKMRTLALTGVVAIIYTFVH